MATVLRPWISSLLEKELLNAYHCFKSADISGTNIREGHRQLSPDCVTLNLTKQSLVQVVEFDNSGRSPLGATLSDGHRLIQATFSDAATAAFRKQHVREISGIRGGFVVLVGYDLYRGSEGSSKFGSPVDILQDDGIINAVEKLQALISGTHPSDPELSPTRSQAGDLYDQLSPTAVSQAVFSTQVYPPMQKDSRRTAGESSKISDPTKFLLARLKMEPPINLSSRGGTAKDINRNAVPTPLSKGEATKTTSRLQLRANSPALSSSSAPPLRSPKPWISQTIDLPLQKERPSTESVSDKENSQESRMSTNQVLELSSIKTNIPANADELPLPARPVLFFDQFQERDPFLGMKRVPRRHVRIPAAQQSLLDRIDSWFELGKIDHTRYANIPAQVQTDLNRFLDRTLSNLTSNRETKEHQRNASVSGNEDDNEYENQGEYKPDDHQLMSISSTMSQIGVADVLDLGRNGANDTSNQSQSSSESSKNSLRNLENAEELEDGDDQASWPSSSPRREDHSVDAAMHDIEENRASLTSSPPRFIEALNLASYVPQVNEQVDGSLPKSSPPSRDLKSHLHLRKLPAFPPSSPAVEDELEIASPYAVGDEVAEDELHEQNKSHATKSQIIPSTAPQSPISVQVKRTPHQAVPGHTSTPQKRSEQRKLLTEAKLTVAGTFSDERIPATFESILFDPLEAMTAWQSSNSKPKSYSEKNLPVNNLAASLNNTNLAGYSPNQEEDRFEDTLADRQVQGDNLPQRVPPKPPLPPPSTTKMKPQPKSPVTEICRNARQATRPKSTKAYVPAASLGHSSPPAQSAHFDQVDRIQVPTTQISPVNLSKRTLYGHKNPESPAAKKFRLTIANKINKNDSPPIDTTEMTRNMRHSFNDSISASSKKHVAPTRDAMSSPPQTTTIRNSSPIVETALLQPSKPVVKITIDDYLSDTERVPRSSGNLFQSQSLPADTLPPVSSAALVDHITDLVGARSSYLTTDHQEERELRWDSEESDLSSVAAPEIQLVKSLSMPIEEVATAEIVPFLYFTEFQTIYPEFTGSQAMFTVALCYIEWLTNSQRPFHRSLWDDFIRVYACEYTHWARQRCAQRKPVMTGLEFYHEKIPKPLFQYGFITPDNLQDAIASLDAKHVKKIREKFNSNELKAQKSARPATTPMSVNLSQAKQREDESPIAQKASALDIDYYDHQCSLQRAVNLETEPGERGDLDEVSLEMRSSDIEIRSELLAQSAETTPSRSRQSSRLSSINPAASVEVLLEQISAPQAQALPPKAHKLKARFFETASQLPTTTEPFEQRGASNTTHVALTWQGSGNEVKPKPARRSLPWMTANSSRSVSSPSGRATKTLPPNEKSPAVNIAAKNFNRPSPSAAMLTLSDPFISDAMDNGPKKRAREESPILGTTSESEREPSPKYRRTSKSATSSNSRQRNCRAAPSPSSGVSSRDLATVLQIDQAAKVKGWINDFYEAEEQQLSRTDVRRPETQRQEVEDAHGLEQENKPKLRKLEAKEQDTMRSEVKKGEGNQNQVKEPRPKKPLTAEAHRAAIRRRMEMKFAPGLMAKGSAGLISRSSTPRSTPVKEQGSSSGNGNSSKIEKRQARKADEAVT